MSWLLSKGGIVDAASGRLLEDSSGDADDLLPAKAAFAGAIAIFLLLIVLAIVLIAVQYVRERDALVHAGGRSHDVSWTESLSRSIFPGGGGSGIMSVGSDVSAKQTAILDAKYNLQTVVIALLQASFSMLILGGIQIDFQLTWVIVLSVVAVWTCVVGVFMTIWMSYVAEGEESSNIPEHDTLRELKIERRKKPMTFLRHFVEVSLFKPMVNPSEINAGDIYQDIGRDGSRTFLLGVGQIILLSMYTWSIIDDGSPDFSQERIYTFYCLGIFMQVSYLSGKDVLYKSIYDHWKFWGNVFCAARKDRAYTWEPPKHLLYHSPRMALLSGSIHAFNNDACVRLKDTPFLYFRFLFSTIVNVGGLSVISLLLPLQLASKEDPLSFVISAVGAYFILGIDDYGGPVTYSLVNERTPGRVEMASVGAAAGHSHNDLESGLLA